MTPYVYCVLLPLIILFFIPPAFLFIDSFLPHYVHYCGFLNLRLFLTPFHHPSISPTFFFSPVTTLFLFHHRSHPSSSSTTILSSNILSFSLPSNHSYLSISHTFQLPLHFPPFKTTPYEPTSINHHSSMTPLNNTPQQHPSTTPLNNTPQQHPSTTPFNNTLQQHPSTTPLNNTPQQHPSTTPLNNTPQ